MLDETVVNIAKRRIRASEHDLRDSLAQALTIEGGKLAKRGMTLSSIAATNISKLYIDFTEKFAMEAWRCLKEAIEAANTPYYEGIEKDSTDFIETVIPQDIKKLYPNIAHNYYWRDSSMKDIIQNNLKTANRRVKDKIASEIAQWGLERKNTMKSTVDYSRPMYAFISYQTEDKLIAGKVKIILESIGIESFLAHEDITVSDEWRLIILEKLKEASIFVCLLSGNYYQSSWCYQELGIAAYRKNMTIIPLSLDGEIPKGFAGIIQSIKIDPEKITLRDIVPGIVKCDFKLGTDVLISIVGGSRSYREAERNFKQLWPYVSKLSDDQVVNLLEKCAENDQVYDAGECATKYIPPLLESHGRLLENETLSVLKERIAYYN